MNDLDSILTSSAGRLDQRMMLAIGAEFGLSQPSLADLIDARVLAGQLMDHEVVSLDTLTAVQQIQSGSTLIFQDGGRTTGVCGQLLLRPAAVRQLFAGAFDALDVDVDLLSREGETPAAGYCWGVAASSKAGAGAVLGFSRAVRARLFPDLTIFTRAVTPIGRHIATTRYGYEPLRGPDDDVMIRRAVEVARAA